MLQYCKTHNADNHCRIGICLLAYYSNTALANLEFGLANFNWQWEIVRGGNMQSTWFIYFIFFILIFLIYLPRKKRRKYAANKIFTKNKILNEKGKEGIVMRELAERLIGKDVYVKMLEGNADGVVKEVTDSGIVLENKNGLQILNLNYIMKIREYPYKNGKRATIWGE